MDRLNERLVRIMDSMGYKKSEWAELLDISPAIITHIYKGRNKAGVDFVQKILKKVPQVNERWLLLGEGDMIKTAESGIPMILKEKLRVLETELLMHQMHSKSWISKINEINGILSSAGLPNE